ncbi:MAG: GNAT family N-acetyltransferase [Thermoleophilia bacterium]
MAVGASATEPRLARPAGFYHASYLRALAEYQVEGLLLDVSAAALADPLEFAHYVAALVGEERHPGALRRYLARLSGEAPPPVPNGGYVPQTTLWWVAGDEYLGRISIRHHLSPRLRRRGGHIGYDVRPSARLQGHATAMLAAALPLAATLGVDPACIDCESGNVGSRRVIEKNGGYLRVGDGEWLYYYVPTTIRP